MPVTAQPGPQAARQETPAPRCRRVLISGGLATGGPQTHVPLLCAVLQQAGAEVTIASASTNWSPAALEKLRRTGVKIVVSPFGFGRWRSLGKLWAFLAWPFLLAGQQEVLYGIGEGRMHVWTSRFLRRNGFKIYHEIVTAPAPGSVAAQVAARMDGLVANSENVAQAMRRIVPGVPVRAIPFLTSAAPTPAPSPRPARGREILRIAFLGRLVAHKRPDRLIEAMRRWIHHETLAPLRLDLYGGDYDGEGPRLRALIAENGLGECVALRGEYAIADLDRIFAQTDLVVLPSEYEGLPLVLVEAMQRGVPVVATSAGGTAELGEDNPDVIITPGTGWEAFESGLITMAARLRGGQIDSVRLHAWTEAHYGFEPVAAAWREALLSPRNFFAAQDDGEGA